MEKEKDKENAAASGADGSEEIPAKSCADGAGDIPAAERTSGSDVPADGAQPEEIAENGGKELCAGDASPAEGLTADDLKYKNGKEVAKSGLLGVFIGLAVIVPGISGSTVAIIFKLYHKFLYAIGNLFKKFKRCAAFLLPIAAGLAVGFIVGFFAVQRALEIAPFTVIALFAGLMFGAFPAVKDEIKGAKRTPQRIVLFAAGLMVPVAVSLLSTFLAEDARSLADLSWYHYLLFLVLGYVMAVTQIVPGLSATAILMVFGYFTPLMDSVHLSYWRENPQIFLVYLCLVAGFAAGLFIFSKVLNKIFEKKRETAFFLITGLSLGSVLTMFFNPDVFAVYKSWAGGSPFALDLALGIVLFAAGVAVAYLFVRYERKKQ